MVRTTKAQRKALKAVYDRGPIFATHQPNGIVNPQPAGNSAQEDLRMSYREFRRLAQPTFGMDGAIVVPWCGMWLAIETDGYTHS